MFDVRLPGRADSQVQKTPVTTRIGPRQQGLRGGLTRSVGTARSMATGLARVAPTFARVAFTSGSRLLVRQPGSR